MIRFSQSDNEALNKRAFINNQDSLNDLRLNILPNKKEQARFEREIEAKDHISRLQDQIKHMAAMMQKNKVFTYMIIHDVKHPITAIIQSFRFLMAEFKDL